MPTLPPPRRLAALALVLASALVSAQAPQAQTPDSLRAAADSVALPPVSTDPITGETATEPAPSYGSLDARIVRAVYRVEQPAFAAVMRGVNETAYPAFVAPAPVAAGLALARGGSLRPAFRIGASEALTTGAVLALKNVLRRPRPYRAMPGVAARDRHDTGDAPADPFSFPSGHAAISFAVATSVTLSDARLAAPAYVWATAVSVSRVWHGVHYPSDVLAGAALGAGSAVLVHVLLPSTSADDGAPAVAPFAVSISF